MAIFSIVGTATTVGTYSALLAVGVFLVGFWVKARTEETLPAGEFGPALTITAAPQVSSLRVSPIARERNGKQAGKRLGLSCFFAFSPQAETASASSPA